MHTRLQVPTCRYLGTWSVTPWGQHPPHPQASTQPNFPDFDTKAGAPQLHANEQQDSLVGVHTYTVSQPLKIYQVVSGKEEPRKINLPPQEGRQVTSIPVSFPPSKIML